MEQWMLRRWGTNATDGMDLVVFDYQVYTIFLEE